MVPTNAAVTQPALPKIPTSIMVDVYSIFADDAPPGMGRHVPLAPLR
jgi:hypothetical protein